MSSDENLLRRYSQEGSEEAFTELVRRHADFVYAAARRQCGSGHRAEDVTQQVFTELARKAGRLCERDNLLGWLFISTRYAAAKVAREEDRRDRREREAVMLSEHGAGDGPASEWEQIRPQLDAALESLESTDRTAILLRVLKGHSFAEVGEALRVSEEAARKRVDRALEKLRLLLVRRGITSTGAALAVVISSQSAVAAPAGLAVRVAQSAVAAGGAAPLAGVLQFMTTTKGVAGLAMVAVAVSVGSAVYEHRQQLQAETECAQAVKDDLTQGAHLRLLKDQIEAAEREASQPPAKSGAGDSALAADYQRGRAFLAAFPEAAELLREKWRGSQAPFLAQLVKTLDLTPEQERLVAQYLMQRAVNGFTNGEGTIAVPLTDSGQPLTSEEDTVWQARIRAALGEEKFARFPASLVDCSTAMATRAVLGEIAASTFTTDTPLSASQAETLAGVLLKCDTGYRSGSNPFSSTTVDWSRVIEEAGGFLGAAQIEAVRAIWMRNVVAAELKKQQTEGTAAKGKTS